MIRDLKEIYSDISSYLDKSVTIQGWIRNHRKQKTIGFIDFNDGTSFKGIQIVYDENIKEFDTKLSQFINLFFTKYLEE